MDDFTGEIVDIVIIGCDRCTENHDPVTVYPLTRTQEAEGKVLTHYGHCPVNDEPFFIVFVEEDDQFSHLLLGKLKPYPPS